MGLTIVLNKNEKCYYKIFDKLASLNRSLTEKDYQKTLNILREKNSH